MEKKLRRLKLEFKLLETNKQLLASEDRIREIDAREERKKRRRKRKRGGERERARERERKRENERET